MGMLFAMFGAVAGFMAVLATTFAFKSGGSDIQLILGGVYGVVSAVFLVGAGIIFRMDDNHSKKDTPQ